MNIYADKVVMYTRARRKKKKVWKEGNPINWNGYKFTHDIRTMKGRCAIQDDLRMIMFSLIDCAGREMGDTGEMEVWRNILHYMSDSFTDFYAKKHNIGVWNH